MVVKSRKPPKVAKPGKGSSGINPCDQKKKLAVAEASNPNAYSDHRCSSRQLQMDCKWIGQPAIMHGTTACNGGASH